MSMEQQDELFQLIRSLSKSEKKFFTQYVNIYEKGSSPIYLQLFDFLNTEPVYDEAKIFKKFREANFKKNFPVTKHYLKNLICRLTLKGMNHIITKHLKHLKKKIMKSSWYHQIIIYFTKKTKQFLWLWWNIIKE